MTDITISATSVTHQWRQIVRTSAGVKRHYTRWLKIIGYRKSRKATATLFAAVLKMEVHKSTCQKVPCMFTANNNNNKKLSYRRETARQLPTWRGLGPPANSPSAPSGYTYAYGRIRKQQRTYVKRAVH